LFGINHLTLEREIESIELPQLLLHHIHQKSPIAVPFIESEAVRLTINQEIHRLVHLNLPFIPFEHWIIQQR
jgi:hypothetical protein